ncbi:MAG: winged helix-turn-helix transcriptional regulator [Candidatus Bathyarchaeota archaeon]|nr:winged helix-turn-helix transcriptional regulator [Candidatus Bathyarchaeota archaeon]
MASEKKIDELDIKIIKELLKNSRTSFSEIAKKCGVTTATINNRFKELKETGIITGSTVIVDLTHFGVECDGTLLLNVDPQRLDEFLNDTKKMIGEFFAAPQKLNDKYNVTVWSPIKNIRELENLKQSLKQHSAVIDVKTNIWTYMKVSADNLNL